MAADRADGIAADRADGRGALNSAARVTGRYAV